MSAITPKVFRKRVLALKAESTIGTYAAMTNADAGFRIHGDPKLKINGPAIQRERPGDMGHENNVVGKRSTELSFQGFLQGNGTASPGTLATLIMPALGFHLTTATYNARNPSAGAVSAADFGTLSADLYQDGRLKSARGIMGNAKFTFEAGNPLLCEFDGKGGYYQDPADSAILTGMTYEAVTPPLFAGAGASTVGGSTAYPFDKLVLDMGHDIQLREDPNSAGGYLCGWIANRVPKITVAPEAGTLAGKNWYALHSAQTTTDIVLVVGSDAGNTITATLHGCTPMDYPNDDNRGGRLVDSLDFEVTGDIVFAYT